MEDFTDRSDICAGCPLADARYVPHSGSFDTRYFCCGAAPGREEEREGRAFTGPAGTMVKQTMADLGLAPVFTNVLKRRPKGKKPSKSECFRCGLHLIEEMKNYQVEVILALGQVPFQFLLGDGSLKVSDVHGLPIPLTRFGMTFIVVATHDAGYIQRVGGLDSKAGDQWLADLEDYRDVVNRVGRA